jgi:hypothetical protein
MAVVTMVDGSLAAGHGMMIWMGLLGHLEKTGPGIARAATKRKRLAHGIKPLGLMMHLLWIFGLRGLKA